MELPLIHSEKTDASVLVQKKLPPEFSMTLNSRRQQACQNTTATSKH